MNQEAGGTLAARYSAGTMTKKPRRGLAMRPLCSSLRSEARITTGKLLLAASASAQRKV